MRSVRGSPVISARAACSSAKARRHASEPIAQPLPRPTKPSRAQGGFIPREFEQVGSIGAVPGRVIRPVADRRQPVFHGRGQGARVSEQCCQTAQAVAGRLLRGGDLCPHRVEMDVVHHSRQRVHALNQERLIAALEQVPALQAQPVEPRRHRTLPPVHPFTQRRLRGLHRQVKMISHQHIGVHSPSERGSVGEFHLGPDFLDVGQRETIAAEVRKFEEARDGLAELAGELCI